MDTIEHFSHFLTRIGAHHFLAVGIAVVVIWLLVSGLKRGLKKGGGEKDLHENDEQDEEKEN